MGAVQSLDSPREKHLSPTVIGPDDSEIVARHPAGYIGIPFTICRPGTSPQALIRYTATEADIEVIAGSKIAAPTLGVLSASAPKVSQRRAAGGASVSPRLACWNTARITAKEMSCRVRRSSA